MTDDGIWKRRFFGLMLVRLAGTALALLGLAVAAGKLGNQDRSPVLGVALLIVGLIIVAVVPRQISRGWRRP